MKKNILIISTTPRKGGNSEILADEFMRGALEAGHNVEKVWLYDKQIGFCKGCLSCHNTKKCIVKDDANEIVHKMVESDTIVFATPVYFYDMCGQMKTLLDRSNQAYTLDYNFRDIYLIATAAENEMSAIEGTIHGLQGWIDCFEHAKPAGVIYGIDLTNVGEAKNAVKLLEESYEMGKSVK